MPDYTVQIGDEEIDSKELPAFLAMLDDAEELVHDGGTATITDGAGHLLLGGFRLDGSELVMLRAAIIDAVSAAAYPRPMTCPECGGDLTWVRNENASAGGRYRCPSDHQFSRGGDGRPALSAGTCAIIQGPMGQATVAQHSAKAFEMFSAVCLRELGINGTEFLRRWDLGQYSDIDDDRVPGLTKVVAALLMVR